MRLGVFIVKNLGVRKITCSCIVKNLGVGEITYSCIVKNLGEGKITCLSRSV